MHEYCIFVEAWNKQDVVEALKDFDSVRINKLELLPLEKVPLTFTPKEKT